MAIPRRSRGHASTRWYLHCRYCTNLTPDHLLSAVLRVQHGGRTRQVGPCRTSPDHRCPTEVRQRRVSPAVAAPKTTPSGSAALQRGSSGEQDSAEDGGDLQTVPDRHRHRTSVGPPGGRSRTPARCRWSYVVRDDDPTGSTFSRASRTAGLVVVLPGVEEDDVEAVLERGQGLLRVALDELGPLLEPRLRDVPTARPRPSPGSCSRVTTRPPRMRAAAASHTVE